MIQRSTVKVRVLMANEPRAYRQVIAETLRSLRPNVEFTVVEPDVLEETVSLVRPHMVICNQAPAAVRERVPIWVELYTGHGARSVVNVRGDSSVIEDMQLSDLLSLVDRTEILAQPD